jgi:hypothetical protein
MQIFQRNAAGIAILAMLVLAGCPAPLERPEAPPQYSYRVASTPYAAAICIGRNAKARGQSAEERTYGESGMEVIVRGGGTPLATARIVRDGTFSSVLMTVAPQAPGDRVAFSRALVAGC